MLVADPHTRALGLAWRLGHDTGAALGAVLARVADDLAAAAEQRRAVAVALAGPRASAAVLTGLPLLGLLWARRWGRARGPSCSSRPAVACCAAWSCSTSPACCWMRRILRVAGRP